jgi:hypothetical protein
VPYLRLLVSSFTLLRPMLEPSSSHVGFVVNKAALGQIPGVHMLLLPIITPTAPHSSSSSAADTIGEIVSNVRSGLSLTTTTKNYYH